MTCKELTCKESQKAKANLQKSRHQARQERLQKMDESAQDNQEQSRKRRYKCNGQVAIENDSIIQDTAGAARL